MEQVVTKALIALQPRALIALLTRAVQLPFAPERGSRRGGGLERERCGCASSGQRRVSEACSVWCVIF